MHAAAELKIPSRGVSTPVHRLTGAESLSRPFRFDLSIAVAGHGTVDELLGVDVELSLFAEAAEPIRVIAGTVARARIGSAVADGSRIARLRIAPHWSRLAHRRNSRVFQDLTTLDIATAIAAEHGVVVRSELIAPPRPRVYCVQHQETDLDFLERLFADEGLVYLFGPPQEGRHPVVVFDEAARYPALSGDARLVHRPVDPGASFTGLDLDERSVTRMDAIGRTTPAATYLREYDLERPTHLVESAEPRGAAQAVGAEVQTWYEHHGAYSEHQPAAHAEIAQRQVERDRRTFEGRSLCRRLAPGAVFELEAAEGDLGGGYAVIGLRHRIDGDQTTAGKPIYANRFAAVTKQFLHRPPRPPRRVQQSLETATVVGPPGEAIHTDELGRIKVQFHWDRLGRGDEHASCWLRVSQAWSGPAWGTQLIPRVGMEVIVGFLGGDPDRPIVLGTVDNGTHHPSFPLPKEKTRSGIKTRSVPTEGYNELSFEDRGGEEQIRVRAQRNLAANVLHDTEAAIGHDARVIVGGRMDVEVYGARSTVVRGRDASTFESDTHATWKASSTSTVMGDCRLDVVASRHVHVAGVASSQVDADRSDRTELTHSVAAGKSYMLRVGATGEPGTVDLHSTGAASLVGDRRVLVESSDSILLRCGESSIEVTPRSIVLRAATVVLAGDDSLTASGNGPAIELSDKALWVSDEVRIVTKSGSLELGSEATLRGDKINLASAKPKPALSESTPEEELQTVKVVLTDENFEPYANKRYEARAEGVTIEGTTDGEGRVTLELPKTAREASLTVWLDGYPTGRRREWTLVLEELPSIDLLAGVQARLKNLGYYDGPTNGDRIDAPTECAIRDFQRDHGLPVTGIPDDETRAALVERYGH